MESWRREFIITWEGEGKKGSCAFLGHSDVKPGVTGEMSKHPFLLFPLSGFLLTSSWMLAGSSLDSIPGELCDRVTCCLTLGIQSEKCVVRIFHHYVNITKHPGQA